MVSILWGGFVMISGCRSAHEVATSSYNAAAAPASTTTVTTTTTTDAAVAAFTPKVVAHTHTQPKKALAPAKLAFTG